MLVKAQKALPGKRYRTQKGILVEVSIGGSRDDYGNPKPKFEPVTRRILVHRVGDDGVADLSKAVPIPAEYMLDDELEEADSRKLHRMHAGRKPHADKTWRGWAFKHPTRPEKILALAQEWGLYIKPAANYFALAWNGVLFCVVYRNGRLAFPRPAEEVKDLVTHVPNDGFCEYRVRLADVKDLSVVLGKLDAYFRRRVNELRGRNVGGYAVTAKAD